MRRRRKVIAPVADHHAGCRVIACQFQGMGQKRALVVAGAVHFGAELMSQVAAQAKMCGDAAGEKMRLCRGQVQGLARGAQGGQGLGNAVEHLGPKQAGAAIDLAIGVQGGLRVRGA